VTLPRLVHHELCFGCGRTNLFGLMMDVEAVGEHRVRGRGFIKQDHQGAVPGTAHDGIVAAALSEAMAFAVGVDGRAVEIDIRLHGPVPVGTFIELEARVRSAADGHVEVSGSAAADGRQVASAQGVYRAS
jgi:acyl-coenzyme A thioesterase PaaI-like protein